MKLASSNIIFGNYCRNFVTTINTICNSIRIVRWYSHIRVYEIDFIINFIIF